MSAITLSASPPSATSQPTLTLNPSPTTSLTTERIIFTTIVSLSTLTQLCLEPSAPAPPSPPYSPATSPIDTNFIILISLTGATFLLLLILAIAFLYLLQKRRQKRQHHLQTPETNERVTESPALTSFPLPPATPRLQAPTTESPTPAPLFSFTAGREEERARPTTAPPSRPSRSASTPFLGPEYENKMFIPPTPSQFQIPPSSPSLQKPLFTTTKPSPPIVKPTTAFVPSVTDTSWKIPSSNPRKQSTPTPPHFTEEETTIGEIGAAASWFGIPEDASRVGIEEEQRETFDFFRFPVGVGGQAVGTRASSGVFPDERERREDG